MYCILNQRSEDDDDDEDEEVEEDDTENIAEILIAQANKDMDEKKAKDLFDAQIKKKLILKKKSDKEYEAYWIKQKGKERSCIVFTCLSHPGYGIHCLYIVPLIVYVSYSAKSVRR